MKVLITGGAGFVGSQLARAFRRQSHSVVVFDNLRRRGSEFNLPLLQREGICFVHGDIRSLSDLDGLPPFDLLVEASAEPSVLAGLSGSPAYVLETNLNGTANCLELLRRRGGQMVFLSTSRVYSIEALREIPLTESATRFEIADNAGAPGLSVAGISEGFCTRTARSFYGTSKLASEMLIQEYAAAYGLDILVNRCGVLCGPGQFGHTDQGVFTLWLAAHEYGVPLEYRGFGGSGKQVRDLLHPADLFALIEKQLPRLSSLRGEIFNIGGGRAVSTSLLEWTKLAREVTGKQTPIGSKPETVSVDVPLYLTDSGRATREFDWTPRQSPQAIAQEIVEWLRADSGALKELFTRGK